LRPCTRLGRHAGGLRLRGVALLEGLPEGARRRAHRALDRLVAQVPPLVLPDPLERRLGMCHLFSSELLHKIERLVYHEAVVNVKERFRTMFSDARDGSARPTPRAAPAGSAPFRPRRRSRGARPAAGTSSLGGSAGPAGYFGAAPARTCRPTCRVCGFLRRVLAPPAPVPPGRPPTGAGTTRRKHRPAGRPDRHVPPGPAVIPRHRVWPPPAGGTQAGRR
jgi:hypothetical protein